MRPGANVVDTRKIGPGLRAVAFMTVPVPPSGALASLRRRLTVSGATVEPPRVGLRAAAPIVIGPPLRGTD
jgi:hypothetical protein